MWLNFSFSIDFEKPWPRRARVLPHYSWCAVVRNGLFSSAPSCYNIAHKLCLRCTFCVLVWKKHPECSRSFYTAYSRRAVCSISFWNSFYQVAEKGDSFNIAAWNKNEFFGSTKVIKLALIEAGRGSFALESFHTSAKNRSKDVNLDSRIFPGPSL